MIELYEPGYRIDHARWDGSPGEVIMIELPALLLNRLLQGDAQPLDIQTRHELFDAPLEVLVNALWNEAGSGSHLGPLYVQGLTLALVGLLSARHGAVPSMPSRRIGSFGSRDRDRLRDMIAVELSGDLRIERLAGAVSMSPHHFARTFRVTFGQAPHSFVLERRIEAASRALRSDPDRPVADIASECGFSSQAHFTEAFRRKIGTTPARWRRDA
jgi:AraC family transcriptional regulator